LRPAIRDSSVVLPEPLGPRIVTNSPCVTAKGRPNRPRQTCRSAWSPLRDGCPTSRRAPLWPSRGRQRPASPR
jgi:hypothetical protein